jgi:hypothetical protein
VRLDRAGTQSASPDYQDRAIRLELAANPQKGVSFQLSIELQNRQTGDRFAFTSSGDVSGLRALHQQLLENTGVVKNLTSHEREGLFSQIESFVNAAREGSSGERGAFSPQELGRAGENLVGSEGAIILHDSLVRSGYHEKIKQAAAKAERGVEEARANRGLAAAERAARAGSAERTALRNATQGKQSPVGRALSKAIESQKAPKTFEQRVATEARGGEPTFKTYETIAGNIAESRGFANRLATGGKVLGGIGVAVGVGLAIHNVAKAPEGERGKVAAEETGGLLGGLGFGLAGASAGVFAVELLAATTPVGWAVFAGALIGSLALGYFGATLGRGAGGELYDRAAR